jgi:hypothetical protein
VIEAAVASIGADRDLAAVAVHLGGGRPTPSGEVDSG